MKKIHLLIFASSLFALGTNCQDYKLEYIPACIDFSDHLQEWDGFGFNYVETAQTRNYEEFRQDYGGFSLLSETQQEEILELVFGTEGLQVQILKLFLDPYHQPEPGGPFNHERTTRQMLSFVDRGLDITRKRGDDLELITTLYGPPAWATRQKFLGGRDMDPAQMENLARYMADWTRYLRDRDMPANYLSLHNEGEDFYRWDFEKGTQRFERFDFNMYWPPALVNDFLKLLPGIMQEYGLSGVKLSNGEPSNWTRFYHWGYARALYEDKEALGNLGLLTTHGFINGNMGKLSYGTANGLTTHMLRREKPDLHAWITSFSWGEMGLDFVRMVHEHLYTAGVNAIIPWAGIQNQSKWIGGDPNLGCAIQVHDSGTYELTPAYFFYKQLTRAGYRGMQVAQATLANPQAFLIAFSGGNSHHPDAFVLSSNMFIWKLPLRIQVEGTTYTRFKAYRTRTDGTEQFHYVGVFELEEGSLVYDPPQGSTTTFIGLD